MAILVKLIYQNTLAVEKPMEGRDFDYFYTGQDGDQPEIESIPQLHSLLEQGLRNLYGTIGNSGLNGQQGGQRQALVDMETVLRVEETQ